MSSYQRPYGSSGFQDLPAQTTAVTAAALNTIDVGVENAHQIAARAPYRNLLYAGSMQVAQRGTSTASVTTSGYRACDRWHFDVSSLGTWTISKETDAPTGSGLRYSLKAACTTADASPAGGDYARIEQRLEGYDVQRIAKGTASAQPLTLSFWVKASTAGTYVAELVDTDNTRYCSKAYTITDADQWEYVAVTFPADTTGALTADANESLRLCFWAGAGADFTSGTLGTTWHTTAANRAAGQVNVAGATSRYLQVTGVQLEVGSVATDFEFLSFGDDLARCQRYYQRFAADATDNFRRFGSGFAASTTAAQISCPAVCTMRATPTLDGSSTLRVQDGANGTAVTSMAITQYTCGPSLFAVTATVASGLTQFRPYHLEANGNAAGYIAFTAEL